MKIKFYFTILLVICTLSGHAQNLQLSGGNAYSLALCSNSVVYGWGTNDAGQANGSSITAPIINPVTIPGLPSNIKQISASSGSHALALDCNGQIWSWGLNNCGQLGTSAFSSTSECNGGTGTGVVAKVPNIGIGQSFGPAIQVNGSTTSTYALMSVGGYVLAWGRNIDGDLGNNNNTNSSTPTYVQLCSGGNLGNIIEVIAGDYTGYALDKNGNVWSWGKNDNSDLGRTGSQTCAALVQADYNNDGTPDGPLKKIALVSGGDTHGLAMDSSGALWTWGGGWGPGQLGNANGSNRAFAAKVPLPTGGACGTVNNNVGSAPFIGDPGQKYAIYISAGQASSVAVLNDGTVITWGANMQYTPAGCNYGVLGQGNTSTSANANCPGYVLTGAGTQLQNIVKVSRGDGWYFAIDKNNQAYAWGVNMQGQLGNLNTNCQQYAVPISLPSGCSLAIPCASKPYLGADQAQCPTFALSTSQLNNVFQYIWDYRSTTLTGWSSVTSGTGTSFSTLTGSNLGQYRLTIQDTRGFLTTQCGTCPPAADTITFSPPACSSTPSLGASLQVCQPVSQVLNSGLTGATVNFEWSFSSASSTTGWAIQSTGLGLNTYTANQLGFYRVRTINNTTCTGCIPSSYSYIQLTTAPSVFNAGPSSICSTVAGTGSFTITTSAGGGSYYWYTNPSGGTALNTAPGLSISGVSVSQTSTLLGCNGVVLYVQDQSSINGKLITASGLTTQLCNTSSNNDGGSDGHRSPLLIQTTRNVTINSVTVVVPSYSYGATYNYTVNLYSNNPTGGGYCGSCTPAGNKDGEGSVISSAVIPSFTVPANTPAYSLTLTFTGFSVTANTKYWLEVTGSNTWWFNGACSQTMTTSGAYNGVYWANPIWDNTGQNVIQALTAVRDGSYTGGGNIFNIGFTAGNVSACTRIPVCANINCPLPVSYASLNATKVNNTVLVSWSTYTEQNSSRFVVERSYDGISFESIGTISAKGNGSSLNSYEFLDANPGRGTIYYRLVEYDLDNSYTVSNIVSVNFTPLADFQIIPNPNNGNFTVKAILNSKTAFELKITNSLGVAVWSSEENSTGEFIRDINLSNIAAGVYCVSIKAGDAFLVKKVVID